MYCPKCGQNISNGEGREYCGHCGQKLSGYQGDEPIDPREAGLSAESSVSDPVNSGQVRITEFSSPWEDESSVSFVRGLILTINQTLFHPSDFFRYMPRSGGQMLPVLYSLILGIIGAIFGLLSEFFAESPVMTHGNLVRNMAISSILVLPLLIVFEVYVGSLILHLSMIVFGARKENFTTTLKIISYSSSPNIFYGVPFIGWLVAAAWSLWITVVGIRVTGGVSLGRAILAAIAPAVLLIVIFAGMIFFLISLIGFSSLV